MLRLKAQGPRIQTLVHAIFPPECLTCRTELASDDGLCGTCWRDTPFIDGAVCEACGVPLSGDVQSGDTCDSCRDTQRPWTAGRAALLYEDRGRQLVLSLKHGDRQELARPGGRWIAERMRPLLPPDTLVLGVPLHWTRLAKRRYNQSVLLAHSVASHLDFEMSADTLKRVRVTQSLDGKGQKERFDELRGAIEVSPKRVDQLSGRSVLVVDDVMTSGATLAACTQACLLSNAREVFVGVLARVAKST